MNRFSINLVAAPEIPRNTIRQNAFPFGLNVDTSDYDFDLRDIKTHSIAG